MAGVKHGVSSFQRQIFQNSGFQSGKTSLTFAGSTTAHSKPFSSKVQGAGNSNSEKVPVDISGIFPPVPTPFRVQASSRGSTCIDLDLLQKNFEVWNKIPFKGYVLLGSNGEPPSLSRSEKFNLLKSTRFGLARKDAVIIAGLGAYGTEETIEICQEVGEAKLADAALIITPSFFKGQMTDTALGRHYEAIADQSPLPIILYSVPSNTNIDLSPDLVKALAQHPNIIGLKDSGGDITKIGRIVHETNGISSGFQVLAGSAGFLLPALLMGCVGGVCALANVLGPEVCQLYELYQQKNWTSALELQRRLILPNTMVTQKYGVPGLKFSMDLKAGLSGGSCRAPLSALTSTEMKTIQDVFVAAKFV